MRGKMFEFYGMNVFKSWFLIRILLARTQRELWGFCRNTQWPLDRIFSCKSWIIKEHPKKRNPSTKTDLGTRETFESNRSFVRSSNVATSLLCYNHIFHTQKRAPGRFTFVINHRKYYRSCIINLFLFAALWGPHFILCGASCAYFLISVYLIMGFI